MSNRIIKSFWPDGSLEVVLYFKDNKLIKQSHFEIADNIPRKDYPRLFQKEYVGRVEYSFNEDGTVMTIVNKNGGLQKYYVQTGIAKIIDQKSIKEIGNMGTASDLPIPGFNIPRGVVQTSAIPNNHIIQW